MAYLRPSGKRASSSRILALMRSAVSRALEPGSWKMARPTDGLPSSVQVVVLALGAQLDPADVLEVGDLPVGAGLEDDVRELLGLDQPAEGAQRVLEVLARGDRRLADLPGRHLHVLLAQDAGSRRRRSGSATASLSGSSQTRML